MGDCNAKVGKSNLGDHNGIMDRFGFGSGIKEGTGCLIFAV